MWVVLGILVVFVVMVLGLKLVERRIVRDADPDQNVTDRMILRALGPIGRGQGGAH